MQTADARLDRLYRLLPAVHQIRDQERGQPLRALLQVIAEQVNLFEDDIQALYESWFIETCDDWVVPYLADLIGYTTVAEAGRAGDPSIERDRARNRVLVPRREVANTLRYRRRKGTLALLELLAHDVAGWPARAVEFGSLMSRSASLRAPRGLGGGAVNLRDAAVLGRLAGPFDAALRGPSVRGPFGITDVRLFVWRLRAYPVTRAPAYLKEDVGPHCYTFSALGNDAPLFNRPRAATDDAVIADELALPVPIDRDLFSRPANVDGVTVPRASPDYYGLRVEGGASVAQTMAIWAEGWPPGADSEQPIPHMRIIPADLDGWTYEPDNGHVAVDPVRGRIAFPPRQRPRRGVFVSYHYGFSADLGGGEYERPLSQRAGARLIRVEGVAELQAALEPWARPPDAEECGVPSDQPPHAVIEIADSGDYSLRIDLLIGDGHSLQIRAAQRRRPVLRLLDWHSDRSDALWVTGRPGSRFTLDGLLVAGRGVRIDGALRSFTVRHSTLVPGWSLEADCEPRMPSEPSIELIDTHACVVVERSIVGSIQVNIDEVASEPVPIRIADSVIDAKGADCEGPRCEAVGALGSRLAHASLRVARSTLVGSVMAHAIELAEDSIFTGRVTVGRRQLGCMRFCYVPAGSRTPQRFNCQPDLVDAATMAQLGANATQAEADAALQTERRRVRPRFNSLRYGAPTYAQLAGDCAAEIVRGASDESEMGVFHDLFQPQRLANLRTRLEEFVPAAAGAEVIVTS